MLAGLMAAAPTLGAAGDFLADIFGPFSFEGIEPTPPTRTFDGSLAMTVGDRRVELLELGPGHTAGDVVVLPAGTGHQNLEASDDLLVVGAYPPTGDYDLCRGSPKEHEKALASIPLVPPPNLDPVYGKDGPLTRHWRDGLGAPKARAS